MKTVIYTQDDGKMLCFTHAVRQANRGIPIKSYCKCMKDNDNNDDVYCYVCEKISHNLRFISQINQIKRLREQSGCGMNDCKRALEECDWDIAEALIYLRR